MQRQTVCPDCGTTKQVSAEMIGEIVNCKKCGQVFPVIVSAIPSAPARPAHSTPAPADVRQIGQRYVVRGELGQGAYGVVHRADDLLLKRTVAVKMLRPEVIQSTDASQRLEREAKVLAQIVHPNILPVLDFGRCPEGHYVVFPLVNGQTLNDAIPEGGFHDPRKAVRLVSKLLLALHYVYEKHHILHRDVKPANVMLLEGADEALYLMDFGLAACQDARLTRLGNDRTVMGTPAFLSPEQAKADSRLVGHRSDLYSAGVVLFQLLTGSVPFQTSWPDILTDIVHTPPPAPSVVRPGLDRTLDAIVLKALSKKPEDRFATGKAFADVLDQWLQNRALPSSNQPAAASKGAHSVREQDSRSASNSGMPAVSIAPGVVRMSRETVAPPPLRAATRRGGLWFLLFGVLLLVVGLPLLGYYLWRGREKARGQKKDWWESK